MKVLATKTARRLLLGLVIAASAIASVFGQTTPQSTGTVLMSSSGSGGGGSGTVNSGTAGQLTWYGSTGTAVSGNANATMSGGVFTLGLLNSVAGKLVLNGPTSGAVTVQTQSAAGTYTMTLPNTAGSAGQPLLSGGVGNMSYGSILGTTSIFVTHSGTFVSGNTPKYNASGDLVDSGFTCCGTGSPGGSTTQLQRNNAGAFGGIGGATSNGTSVTFSSGNLIVGGSTSGSYPIQPVAVAGATPLVLPDTATASGGKFAVFDGSAGVMTSRLIVGADVNGVIAIGGSQVTSGLVAVGVGGSNLNASGTGGANQFVKQTAVGAAFSVATIQAGDIAAISGCGGSTKFLREDGTCQAVAGGGFDPLDTQKWVFFDDFDAAGDTCGSNAICGQWQTYSSGTGTTPTENNQNAGAHPGVWRWNTGAGTNGTAAIGKSSFAHILGNGALDTKAGIYVDVASTGTQTHVMRWGMMDSFAAAPTNGVWIEWDNNADTHWKYCSRKASSATPCTASTLVASAAAWHAVEITCNAGLTSCSYFVDGTTLGSQTTNLPNTVETGPGFMIAKTAGTTPATIEIDYWKHQVILTATR